MKVAELQFNQRIYPLDPLKSQKLKAAQTGEQTEKAKAFSEVLKKNLQQTDKVRFSAHALKRIEERQLPLGEQTLDRLNNALSQLRQKGSKNSVVFLDETAFVVSVQNSTVVTALENNNTQNIFTNIDSVAIV